MTEQLNVQQMAQRLMTADNILILCHKNPDGDTIGCGSALYCALKMLDKEAAVLCSDAIPSRYAFTNPRLFKGEFEPRTVIAVDVAGLQLFGENKAAPSSSTKMKRGALRMCIFLLTSVRTWPAARFSASMAGLGPSSRPITLT